MIVIESVSITPVCYASSYAYSNNLDTKPLLLPMRQYFAATFMTSSSFTRDQKPFVARRMSFSDWLKYVSFTSGLYVIPISRAAKLPITRVIRRPGAGGSVSGM